jgi:hypothetical protein
MLIDHEMLLGMNGRFAPEAVVNDSSRVQCLTDGVATRLSAG